MSPRLSLPLLLGSLSALAGCTGGPEDTAAPADTEVEVDTDTDTDADTDTDTDADSDTDTDTDADTDEPAPPPVYWELGDPCSGGTPYALYFQDETTGWAGCGSGMGLWSTADGGETFAAAHPSSGRGDDLYINRIVPDPSGGLLVCGHDYSSDPDPLLWRLQDGVTTVLLTYGSNSNDSGSAQMSNCGAVAAAGDGTILVASETAGDMTRSEDDGLTWTAEYRYWEDENLNDGGYAYYYMLNMVAAGGAYYGAGTRIIEPPVFYGPSRHEAGEWYNFHASDIDSFQGEVWALATPDDGATWFAGGRDQQRASEASGFFYRSDDGGASWTDISLGGTVDVMHDVVFAPDGRHGIAVGHRYPPATLGGFIALTEDGGLTWTERDEDVPPLYAAAIFGETFWVSGDGYLARGIFSAGD